MIKTKLRAQKGRPRDPAIDDAILSATIDILNEDGYRHLSTTEVARRAGVYKPAVYRRWPTKLELALAAIGRLAPPLTDPESGDIGADLVDLLLQVARAKSNKPGSDLAHRLRSDFATEPELASAVRRTIINPRRSTAHKVIERAQREGQLRGDIAGDVVMDMLFGSINSRSLRIGTPLTRLEAERIVGLLLDGIGGRRR
ncbi:MAG TPA: TetR/AcrR family transcriptional regulator [Acidimicrobiales bacterium]|nr:TetR/AcrR family transcriptional regulator [Acidimicrobiales bacterium]